MAVRGILELDDRGDLAVFHTGVSLGVLGSLGWVCYSYLVCAVLLISSFVLNPSGHRARVEYDQMDQIFSIDMSYHLCCVRSNLFPSRSYSTSEY